VPELGLFVLHCSAFLFCLSSCSPYVNLGELSLRIVHLQGSTSARVKYIFTSISVAEIAPYFRTHKISSLLFELYRKIEPYGDKIMTWIMIFFVLSVKYVLWRKPQTVFENYIITISL